MSDTNVILFKGQTVAPAFRHLPVKNLGAGIVAGGFPVINYRGKAWSLRYQGNNYPFVRADDGSPLTYLDVIVLGVSDYVSKVFYPPGEWDEDSAGPPVCTSIKGDVPDPGVPEPQSKTCGTCQHNAWATQPNGRRGKACQDHKRLAVLLMPAVTTKMLGSPMTEPAYLKVPPGSLVALKRYGDQLAHQGFPPAAVITRISFTPGKLFEMNFEGKQVLSDKEAPLVLPLVDDPRTLRITGDTPEIREVHAPKKEQEPEQVETGLMEALGTPEPASMKENNQNGGGAAPVKRGRGRPPKAPVTIENEAPAEEPEDNLMEMPAAKPKAAAGKPKAAAPTQWEEGSTDLDREVETLLGQKVAAMMPAK